MNETVIDSAFDIDWWEELTPKESYEHTLKKYKENVKILEDNECDKVHEYFNVAETRPGFMVKFTLPYKYLPNDDFVKEHIALQEKCEIDKVVKCKDYSNRVPTSRFEKLPAANAESLNDEDIDMIFGERAQAGSQHENAVSLEDTSNKTQGEKNIKFINKLLLVGEDAFCLAGSPSITKIRGGINDCAVINTSGNWKDDIVLIVQGNGMLYSIIPSKSTRNIERDTSVAGSTVLQYCDLLAADDWKIISDAPKCNKNDFILMGKRSRMLKFFHYSDKYGFKFINNMILADYKLHDCTFFLSDRPPSNWQDVPEEELADAEIGIDPSPIMLFISAERAQRVIYICVEWTSDTQFHKKVHQLPFLTGEPSNGVFPVLQNRVICYTNNTMTMISANQIMSGESSFVSKKLPTNMRGIISSFAAPRLLNGIFYQNFSIYDEYYDCQVLASATGTVFTCLFDESDFVFIPLTRLKGLRDICPVHVENYDEVVPGQYSLATMSFNRLCEVSIDTSIVAVQKVATNSYQQVRSRKVKNISSDKNHEISFIDGDVWAFSNSSVSQLSSKEDKNITMPYLHLNEIFSEDKTFGNYRNLEIYELDSLEDWREFLGVSFKGRLLMVIANDGRGTYDEYLCKVPLGKFNDSDCYDLLKIEGVNENFPVTEANPIMYRQYSTYMILVNDKEVNLYSLRSTFTSKFTPPFQIEGASFYKNSMVIWNKKLNRALWLKDVPGYTDDAGHIADFIEHQQLNDVIKQFTEDIDFSIEICPSSLSSPEYKMSLVIRSGLNYVNVEVDAPYPEDPLDFEIITASNTSPIDCLNDSFIGLNGVYVYHIEGDVLGYVVLNDRYVPRTVQTVTLPTGRKDVQLKRYTDRSVLAFTTDEVFVVEFKDSEGQIELLPCIYKLKLPYRGKQNYIRDVSFAPNVNHSDESKNGTLAVLYTNGVKLFEPTHVSWIYSNYLLQHTRSTNKKFVYLKKLKRLLIINGDTHMWYCMKLQNGKILPLDSSALDPELTLMNAQDASLLFGEQTYEMVLLHYGKKLKLMKIFSRGNRIIVEPFWEMSTEGTFSKHVDIIREYMYVQEVGVADGSVRFADLGPAVHRAANSPLDAMLQFRYNNGTNEIELAHKRIYIGKGELELFTHAGPTFGLYSTVQNDCVYRRPRWYSSPQFSEAYLHPLQDVPYDFKVVKMIALSLDTCVVVYNCVDDLVFGARVVFYCTKRSCEYSRMLRTPNQEDEAIARALDECVQGHSTVFSALQKSHENDVCRVYPETEQQSPISTRKRGNGTTLQKRADYMRYPISGREPRNLEKPAVEMRNLAADYRTHVSCRASGQYRAIDLSIPVQDATYDAETQTLALLQTNQSVLLLNTDALDVEVAGEPTAQQRGTVLNHGNYVPPSTVPIPAEPAAHVLTEIDYYGRIWQ